MNDIATSKPVWTIERVSGKKIEISIVTGCPRPHIEIRDGGIILWLSERQAAELASGLDQARDLLAKALRGIR